MTFASTVASRAILRAFGAPLPRRRPTSWDGSDSASADALVRADGQPSLEVGGCHVGVPAGEHLAEARAVLGESDHVIADPLPVPVDDRLADRQRRAAELMIGCVPDGARARRGPAERQGLPQGRAGKSTPRSWLVAGALAPADGCPGDALQPTFQDARDPAGRSLFWATAHLRGRAVAAPDPSIGAASVIREPVRRSPSRARSTGTCGLHQRPTDAAIMGRYTRSASPDI